MRRGRRSDVGSVAVDDAELADDRRDCTCVGASGADVGAAGPRGGFRSDGESAKGPLGEWLTRGCMAVEAAAPGTMFVVCLFFGGQGGFVVVVMIISLSVAQFLFLPSLLR